MPAANTPCVACPRNGLVASTLAKIVTGTLVSLVAIPSELPADGPSFGIVLGGKQHPTGGGPLISAKAAEHYHWGAGCDGWHLVKGESLSVIQERMPPGASEVRHSHARARQFFFVLAGQLSVELEGAIEVLGVREGLEVAPGQRHRAFNDSGQDVHFMVISQPPSHGDRVPVE